MTARAATAITGVVAVVAYATLLALDALVFLPQAMAPGQTLAQIHARILAVSQPTVLPDFVMVGVLGAIGVGLAVVVAVLGITQRFPVRVMILLFLSLLLFGAAPEFFSGFGLAMDTADAYGADGGTTSTAGIALWATSIAAFVGIVAVVAATAITTLRPRGPQTARP